jgi:hypothetical protein
MEIDYKKLNDLSEELNLLVENEGLTDEDLREASEGLLPRLCDCLNDILNENYREECIECNGTQIQLGKFPYVPCQSCKGIGYFPKQIVKSGWISVKDKLPQNDIFVLVTNHEYLKKENPRYITIGRYMEEIKSWLDEEFGTMYAPDYWMPLPEPPEDD